MAASPRPLSKAEFRGPRSIGRLVPAAARHFRRDDGCRRRRAPALAAIARHVGRARPGRHQPPLRRRRPLLAQLRRVLSGVRGRRRHRWPLSHVPLIIDPTEWRALETGACSTRRVAGSRAGRRLRRFTADPRRPFAGDGSRRQPGIPPPAGRRRSAGRRASALLRGRCDARRRRALVGARRSRPGAVRRRLCDREPAGAVARRPRHLSGEPRRAAGAVLPGLSGRARLARPPGRRAYLRADARVR